MEKITVLTSVYNSAQFLEGYFSAVKRITNPGDVEILLLHNAPDEDELNIIHKHLPALPFVRHIPVANRESLYASWNRGIRLAKGTYITIWNTDDIRLPSSLADQARCLDEHPEAGVCYGNITIVNEYGKTTGRYQAEPDFDRDFRSFFRNHHIGCFPMWRKAIHETVGYFDEQFRLVADLDFQIRVASEYPMVRTTTDLGYYLENTPTNLSSNRKLQRTERTALNLRHRNYDLLHLPYLYSALKLVRPSEFRWFGTFHQVREWTNPAKTPQKNLSLIFFSVLNLPLDILRFIKYSLPPSYLRRLN